MKVTDFYTESFTVTTAEHTIIYKSKGERGMEGPMWGSLVVAGILTLEWAYPSFVLNYRESVAAFVGMKDESWYVFVVWMRRKNAISEHRIPFSNGRVVYWVTSVSLKEVVVEEFGMTHTYKLEQPIAG
jgi:hypothetical protein